MIIALAVEAIIPAAQYSGSVTANTVEAWNAVIWNDERIPKPTWAELQAVWKAVEIEKTISEYENKTQARLDDFARSLTYDNMMSACTYATSGIEQYRREGQYCVEARDATWKRGFELIQEWVPRVEAGEAIPTWDEIEMLLPPLAWPEGSRGYVPNQ